MRLHSSDHDGHDHHGPSKEPTPAEILAMINGKAEAVDALLGHMEKTVDRLKKLGLEDEDAMRTAIRLHDAESFFFGGH